MKPTDGDVVEYYDSIATTYDSSRFSNSYGRYIDAQERRILDRYLSHCDGEVVEVACGTGRLLDYAQTGVDASGHMLAQATPKYPNKRLLQARAHELPFESGSVAAVYSFHLIMHLDRGYIARMFEEIYRVLRPGGYFIFDFPSVKRRRLSRRNQDGWHGNTDFTLSDIKSLAGERFRIESSCGILYFPIHILPEKMRGCLRPIDSLLCRVPRVKELSSYLVVKLVKI